jgi:uncharacterized protein (UPF0261 family)
LGDLGTLMAKVYVIGTCDIKGDELQFACER